MLLALLDATKRLFVAKRFFFHGSNRILMHSASSYGYFTAEFDDHKKSILKRQKLIKFNAFSPSGCRKTILLSQGNMTPARDPKQEKMKNKQQIN